MAELPTKSHGLNTTAAFVSFSSDDKVVHDLMHCMWLPEVPDIIGWILSLSWQGIPFSSLFDCSVASLL